METLILIAIAAHLNCLSEFLQHRYYFSIFQKKYGGTKKERFFNPSMYWRNKWKDGDASKGEAFFGSTTFLSAFTDTFHLVKGLMLICLFVAVIAYKVVISPIVDLGLMMLLWGVVFELSIRVYKA